MSDPSVQISNGTCYSAKGQKMDSSFIPCGNDFFGHKTCCGAGDNCLADNACFGTHGDGGEGTLLTYLAGCTDPDYKDASCPNKAPYGDQPWTGLVLCGDPKAQGPHQWSACSQQGSPSTLRQGDAGCTCKSTAATPAFTDLGSLANIASLPSHTGQSIGWAAGHVPTQPPPSATTTTSSSSTGPATSSTSGTAGPTAPGPSSSPPADSSDGSSGLSTGAKAGIGVGAGLGGLLLLGLAVLALFLRRRRHHQTPPPPDMMEQQQYQQQPSPFDHHAAKFDDPRLSAAMAPSHLSTTSTTPGTTLSELEPRAARPWSLRSELEGTHTSPSLAEFADMHAAAATNGGPAHGQAPAGPEPRGGARGGELSPVHELPG